MNVAFQNAIINYGGTLITHIALFNQSGTELTGGSPAYARRPVSWTSAVDGLIRPTADLVFDIPAGTNVASWRGFSAISEGVDYGGGALVQETYAGQGQYRLIAAQSGIDINNA